jgi:hypothetical protein
MAEIQPQDPRGGMHPERMGIDSRGGRGGLRGRGGYDRGGYRGGFGREPRQPGRILRTWQVTDMAGNRDERNLREVPNPLLRLPFTLSWLAFASSSKHPVLAIAEVLAFQLEILLMQLPGPVRQRLQVCLLPHLLFGPALLVSKACERDSSDQAATLECNSSACSDRCMHRGWA